MVRYLPFLPGLAADAGLLAYGAGLLFFRVGEIVPLLVRGHPLHCLTAAVALAGGGLWLRSVPGLAGRSGRPSGGDDGGSGGGGSGGGRGVRRLLAAAAYAALVRALDGGANLAPPSPDAVRSGEGGGRYRRVRTAVVTGANSGVGYEAARALAVRYGATVVLACRSEARCSAAADRINAEVEGAAGGGAGEGGRAVPRRLDLASFESVRAFAGGLREEGIRVDTLFNNAGYAPKKGLPVNDLGLEPSFAAMHLSHHLLAELLLEDRAGDGDGDGDGDDGAAGGRMRVVATSSATHHMCALPFAILPRAALDWLAERDHLAWRPGCVDEEFLARGMASPADGAAYFHAKVANVMHAFELPRRHGGDGDGDGDGGATAVAIDLGWVGTAIQPWMAGPVSPTSLGWMRSAEVGVTPVLNAMLRTDRELLDMVAGGGGGGRTWAEGGGIAMDALGQAMEPFSYPWWTERGAGGGDTGRGRMRDLSEKLWEVSEAKTGGGG